MHRTQPLMPLDSPQPLTPVGHLSTVKPLTCLLLLLQVLLPHAQAPVSMSMLALPLAAVLLSMALGGMGALLLGALLRPGSPLSTALSQSSPSHFRCPTASAASAGCWVHAGAAVELLGACRCSSRAAGSGCGSARAHSCATPTP